MRVLVGNTVKTGVADYVCATREEAEALLVALHERGEPERSARMERELSARRARKARPKARRR